MIKDKETDISHPKTKPQLCIELRLESGQSSQLYFAHSPIIIGRSEACDLRLPYPWVSLQHIEVHWSAKGICARDLYAKRPARLDKTELSQELSAVQQELNLHLPAISLHCTLSAYPEMTSYTPNQLTRHLWRPESGWVIWSIDTVNLDVQLQVKYKQTNSLKKIQSQVWSAHHALDLTTSQSLRQPAKIAFEQATSKKAPFTTKQMTNQHTGKCWFLLEAGTYMIESEHMIVELLCSPKEVKIQRSNDNLSQQTSNLSSNLSSNLLTNIHPDYYCLQLSEQNILLTKSAHPPSLESFMKPKARGLLATLYRWLGNGS